jgi:methylglyoxal synthase
MNIAVIAHDNKKADMVAFVIQNIDFFKKSNLYATGTTGKHIKNAGIEVECLKSGPFGGDAQIASLLVEGKIDCVLFFIDPLYSHPHEVDIHMLIRLCNVYNIPLASNIASAELFIKTLKK